MLGFGYSSLPLAIAISGVCLEAQRRRLGLWFGPDSIETGQTRGCIEAKLLGKQIGSFLRKNGDVLVCSVQCPGG